MEKSVKIEKKFEIFQNLITPGSNHEDSNYLEIRGDYLAVCDKNVGIEPGFKGFRIDFTLVDLVSDFLKLYDPKYIIQTLERDLSYIIVHGYAKIFSKWLLENYEKYYSPLYMIKGDYTITNTPLKLCNKIMIPSKNIKNTVRRKIWDIFISGLIKF